MNYYSTSKLLKNTVETISIVSTGDSYWSIAEKYCPTGVDKRVYVSYIKELNDNKDLDVGDEIIILI